MAAVPVNNGGRGMRQDAKVLIRGYGDMSALALELFLESPKHCGTQGPVSDITMDTETDVSTVTFEDADGTTVTTHFNQRLI